MQLKLLQPEEFPVDENDNMQPEGCRMYVFGAGF